MKTYKDDEILKLKDQIAQLEKKMLQSFDNGSGNYNRLKNEQHQLVNKLKKINLLDTNNYLEEKII